MESLATKYRPKTFDDVVGQENVKHILQNQIDKKEVKQAYLFTGPAGTGKTTLARILASAINGGKGQPIEVDGASNNGVDNVRAIIDDSKFKAMDCEWKVYIIDECHMLTTGAWNAMLKVLEEPPVKTIFMMCTTDPQKIPATILSRVQRFDIKKHSTVNIVKRLQYILTMENEEIMGKGGPDGFYNYEQDALEYIAKLAEGGMRDAITMLDKCCGYNENITLENVVNALGSADYATFFKLTDEILAEHADKCIEIIEGLYMDGKDLKQFAKLYSYFLLDIIKYKLLGNFDYISIPKLYAEDLDEYRDNETDFFKEVLQTFIELNAKIKWESNVKPLIEAEVLMLCL
jgi:DNA polymerase-3 subunit gamma/tau